ncbi:putative hydrolase of the HAD superfamily [Nonomuraea fuscirosea]|uniref:Putative hydrolase of the HAD superfamily n=1 Tax=Nonomuraea fuscirosea TaxID=1291556 RepID=A0A2T0M7U2_9ACTN|nr:HAD-IA family hydrolase [Nonomuraea fuscirosea]PRX53476.1 putative hydrolase of the HAD superfamily [Nonomuraea fuscirosea]
MPRVIVLDAMGVLYRYGDVQGRVLIPYLRARGCERTEAEIRAAYRSVTLGRITTGQFWTAAGLPEERDEDYCREHRLTEGAQEALAELAGDGLELACLSNDAAAWSALVRRRFGLERRVRRWFVSSDLRARKPDEEAYEAVLGALGVAPGEVVFVDDRPVNLAPARSLGMRTVLFRSDDTDAHPEPAAGREPHRAVGTMPELVAAVRELSPAHG